MSKDLNHIPGDASFLSAVFDNLYDNAITYSKAGGKVSVTLVSEGDRIHFSIADRGIGIPQKDKDLIFTQFFRATNAISMKNVGTGLGLFICKTVIEGHGGKIWFESDEDKGTVVHFILPTV